MIWKEIKLQILTLKNQKELMLLHGVSIKKSLKWLKVKPYHLQVSPHQEFLLAAIKLYSPKEKKLTNMS